MTYPSTHIRKEKNKKEKKRNVLHSPTNKIVSLLLIINNKHIL